jgi:heme O synthase-like polyprenyltransferase
VISRFKAKEVYMDRKNNNTYPAKKMFRDSLPVLCAIFLAIVSVAYILFRSWSNKLYYERWKEYEDCGI